MSEDGTRMYKKKKNIYIYITNNIKAVLQVFKPVKRRVFCHVDKTVSTWLPSSSSILHTTDLILSLLSITSRKPSFTKGMQL